MQIEVSALDALIVILTIPLIIVGGGIFALWLKKKRHKHRIRH